MDGSKPSSPNNNMSNEHSSFINMFKFKDPKNTGVVIDFAEVDVLDTNKSQKVDVCTNIKPNEVTKAIDEF